MTLQDAGLRQLKSLIDGAKRAVIFTGAGVSTESGIPDFRSPNGIWSKMSPIYFDEFMRSEEARRESWRRKIVMDKDFIAAEPNRGHRAIEKLVRVGKVSCIITQNIDGLHEVSGIPAEKIVELHGNGTYAKCMTCETRFELPPIKEAFERDGTLPICTWCGGIIKTATISFGQQMPDVPIMRAREETLACDLFLAIGSSLVVYPAAGFVPMAKQNGAKLVILTRDPTELDEIADLVLNREIGPTLGDVVGVN
jgi:NAD-dependent deacetylase